MRVCPKCNLKSQEAIENCPDDNSIMVDVELSRESGQLDSKDSSADLGIRPASMIGTTLAGRFLIMEILGKGGMSVVYKAKQIAMDRDVAIKTLDVHVDTKPVLKERLEREVKSLCKLNHPHIVTVHDWLIGEDGHPYIVMDCLRGQSLQALLKEGWLNLERFQNIAVQILNALDYAHKQGVAHRDIKPGNIMLIDDETDLVKVLDFGLAKIREDNRRLTHSGQIWGSPPYMSPEQCMGEEGDGRSDIYSLGAVFYELLTGKDPFCKAGQLYQILHSHIHDTPPPMVVANPKASVPPLVEQVICTALAKDPDDRFQTMAEFKDQLVSALRGTASDVQSKRSAESQMAKRNETGIMAAPSALIAANEQIMPLHANALASIGTAPDAVSSASTVTAPVAPIHSSAAVTRSVPAPTTTVTTTSIAIPISITPGIVSPTTIASTTATRLEPIDSPRPARGFDFRSFVLRVMSELVVSALLLLGTILVLSYVFYGFASNYFGLDKNPQSASGMPGNAPGTAPSVAPVSFPGGVPGAPIVISPNGPPILPRAMPLMSPSVVPTAVPVQAPSQESTPPPRKHSHTNRITTGQN